ncbi:MAG: BamA/TamA family outer membrane protein, partial [Cyanobacteria bacterium]|nr:BamA/TamA family outer membrane protein [Cyanobacteriota bacterium]
LKRIFNTQSFSDVRRVITASPDNPDKYNLTVELDEKKTGAISLGGGVDSLTGFFGSLGYNDPNFLGRGQSFNSGFAVGSGILLRGDGIATTRTVNVDIGWTNPSLFDSVNSLSTGVYGRYLPSFNIPYSAERRIGSDITWSRPLMSIPNMGFSLGLRGEDVHISDKINNGELRRFGISDDERKKEIKGGTFITLTPTIAYDTRDNRFNPTSGWLNTLSVGGSYGARGGSSYGTVVLNLRKYIKVRDGITLALNAQGAATPYGDIPQFNMFRLGGANDVRGYQFGGLGIGNGLLTGSAELRTKVPFVSKIKNLPMLDSLSTAFFADAGQVLSQASSDKLFDRPGFGMSIGAGLRFTIPGVGPMRVDYAIPVANSGSRYVQHFSFGVGQKF